jgi:hypothetical protein
MVNLVGALGDPFIVSTNLLVGRGRQPAPGTAGAVTIGLAVDQPIEQVVSTLRRRGVAFHLIGGYREQATARDRITTDIQRSRSRDQGCDLEL